MRVPPSYRLKKAADQIAGESDYFDSLEDRQQYLREMDICIKGKFGVTLLAALEQLESNAYSTLYKSSMKYRVAQAKAEIKTVQYLKGTLMALQADKVNIESAVNQMKEEIENGV